MGKQNKGKKDVRYRLALIVDSTHEQVWQTTFTKGNMLFISIGSIVLFILIIFSIIAFTPVRSIIPGYPDAQTKRMAVQNAMKIDSLEREITVWDIYSRNLLSVLSGGVPVDFDSLLKANAAPETTLKDSIAYAQSDSILRNEVSQQEKFNVAGTDKKIRNIEGKMFYPPIKGVITEKYSPAAGHPFIDIAASEGSTVYSVLEGTVIGAGWNDETGYTIQIQHPDDIISVYKHNGRLLKSVGDKVKAGTPIALTGNTGSISTGPHLHFELWYAGAAVNPETYINF